MQRTVVQSEALRCMLRIRLQYHDAVVRLPAWIQALMHLLLGIKCASLASKMICTAHDLLTAHAGSKDVLHLQLSSCDLPGDKVSSKQVLPRA